MVDDVGASSSQHEVDDVYVSAVVYVPNLAAVPKAAELAAQRTKTRKDGTLAVTLGSFSIETNDNEERQRLLADALASLWRTFVSAGFWPAPENTGEEIVLSISLTPSWGQAGIAIAPESLRPWMEAQAHLHLNAYPTD